VKGADSQLTPVLALLGPSLELAVVNTERYTRMPRPQQMGTEEA
jgi:hypothetical protein